MQKLTMRQYCKKLLNKMEENRRKANKIYRSEHGSISSNFNDDIEQYDTYRFFGTVFPDSSFGQIVKK